MVPTVLSVADSGAKWRVGDEAVSKGALRGDRLIDDIIGKFIAEESVTIGPDTVSADFLMEKFFARTMSMVLSKYTHCRIGMLAITAKQMDRQMSERIVEILRGLNYMEEHICTVSHTECFMYYTLSQPADIWSSDVSLFELSEDGLRFSQLSIGHHTRPIPVIATYTDLSDSFPYKLLKQRDTAQAVVQLEEIMAKTLHKRNISAVFFTGLGFESAWADASLRRLCVGRRVFKGQNLYTKGACLAAKALFEQSFQEFVFIEEHKAACSVTLKVQKDGRDFAYEFISAGDPWQTTGGSAEIIFDNENTLDFTISSLVKKSSLHAFVTPEMPRRANKTQRVRVSLRMVDRDTLVIRVKDLGFGEFYTSTRQIWEYRLNL
jgi:hypothetical protein